MPPIGAAAAGVGAVAATAASTDFVRKKTRPVEFKIYQKNEESKRTKRVEQAEVIDEATAAMRRQREAARKGLLKALDGAKHAKSVSFIKSGQGTAGGIGAVAHLMHQVEVDLEAAIAEATRVGLPEQAVVEAREALEGIRAAIATKAAEASSANDGSQTSRGACSAPSDDYTA
jgi:hypothetical protein